KKAPVLVTEEMISAMKPGSVIIDLAAATGGNTAKTADNQTITYKGVQIVGNSNLPATMPLDASRLYGKNVAGFIALLVTKEGNADLNFSDELVKGACIAHGGKIVNEKVILKLQENVNP